MKRLPRPHECGPLEREFFAAAFTAAVQAASTKQSPGAKPDEAVPIVGITDDNGIMTQYALPDSPMSRMIDAIIAFCGDDEEVINNVTFRVFVLLGMLRRPALREWVQTPPEEGNVTIAHPALVFAAAEVPLTKKGVFPTAVFMRSVREIAAQEFLTRMSSP